MSSIRAPKRITILGNDEREYKFLVKGGEDLRLDQRIEQVSNNDSFSGWRMILGCVEIIPNQMI